MFIKAMFNVCKRNKGIWIYYLFSMQILLATVVGCIVDLWIASLYVLYDVL